MKIIGKQITKEDAIETIVQRVRDMLTEGCTEATADQYKHLSANPCEVEKQVKNHNTTSAILRSWNTDSYYTACRQFTSDLIEKWMSEGHDVGVMDALFESDGNKTLIASAVTTNKNEKCDTVHDVTDFVEKNFNLKEDSCIGIYATLLPDVIVLPYGASSDNKVITLLGVA